MGTLTADFDANKFRELIAKKYGDLNSGAEILAKELDVKKETIVNSWCRGIRPKLVNLIQIAEHFNKPMQSFFIK